jgi:hypothetical protein
MDRLFYVGVSAALFAAFAFSLNFVVPFIIGDYSNFDFALIRHIVSALVGLYILFSQKGVMRHLTLRNCLQAIWLAFIGYVGYFLTVTGAAVFAGPVIAPAFLGLVPIMLMVIGNQRQGSLPWRSLVMPLALVLVGLALVNGTAFTAEGLLRSIIVDRRAAVARRGGALVLVRAGQSGRARRSTGNALRRLVGADIGWRWRADAGILSSRRCDGPLPASDFGIQLERCGQSLPLGCVFRAAGNRGRRLGLEHRITDTACCVGRAIDRLGNRFWGYRRTVRACSLANSDRSRWRGGPDRRCRFVSPDFL